MWPQARRFIFWRRGAKVQDGELGGAAESLPGIGGVSTARCTGHPLPHSSPSPVPARIADPAPAGGGPRGERRPGEHGPRRGMRISRGKKKHKWSALRQGRRGGRGGPCEAAAPQIPRPRRSPAPPGSWESPFTFRRGAWPPAPPCRSLALPRRSIAMAITARVFWGTWAFKTVRRRRPPRRRGPAPRAGRPPPPAPPPRGERPAVARRCSGPRGPAAAPRRRDRRPWRCLLLPGKAARAAASRQRGARGDRIWARQAPRRQGGRRAQAPGRLGHAPDADGAARGRRSWGRR